MSGYLSTWVVKITALITETCAVSGFIFVVIYFIFITFKNYF